VCKLKPITSPKALCKLTETIKVARDLVAKDCSNLVYETTTHAILIVLFSYRHTGNGCASVLNTISSSGRILSPEKRRKRYLSVSAMKKLSMGPFLVAGGPYQTYAVLR